MGQNRAKASKRFFPVGLRVDTAAASPKLRQKQTHRTISFTLANGVSHNLGAFGFPGKLVAAYASNRTVGTYTSATLKLRNATQSLDLTATLDPSTVATGGATSTFTLAGTQPANVATDNLVLVAAGTFTAQPVEMQIVMVFEPTEDSVIVD